MWKKPAAAAGAAIAWGVAIADLVLPNVELSNSASNLTIAAALSLTGFVTLRAYQRPLGAAYDLGYNVGRRDAIVEQARARRENVTPIRRVPNGLSSFNRDIERQRPLVRDRIEA